MVKKQPKRMASKDGTKTVVDGDNVRCRAGSIQIPGDFESRWFKKRRGKSGGGDGGCGGGRRKLDGKRIDRRETELCAMWMKSERTLHEDWDDEDT